MWPLSSGGRFDGLVRNSTVQCIVLQLGLIIQVWLVSSCENVRFLVILQNMFLEHCRARMRETLIFSRWKPSHALRLLSALLINRVKGRYRAVAPGAKDPPLTCPQIELRNCWTMQHPPTLL